MSKFMTNYLRRITLYLEDRLPSLLYVLWYHVLLFWLQFPIHKIGNRMRIAKMHKLYQRSHPHKKREGERERERANVFSEADGCISQRILDHLF